MSNTIDFGALINPKAADKLLVLIGLANCLHGGIALNYDERKTTNRKKAKLNKFKHISKLLAQFKSSEKILNLHSLRHL